jgi:protein translocase SecG subunit
MYLLVKILPYIQIVVSIILVVSILLQQSGSELGGAFGGSSGSFHHTRRGFEKFLFYLSIISGILFIASALLMIVLKANI